jgi:hypothetical protein
VSPLVVEGACAAVWLGAVLVWAAISSGRRRVDRALAEALPPRNVDVE